MSKVLASQELNNESPSQEGALSKYKVKSQTQVVWHHLYRDKVALIGGLIVLLVVVVAIFAEPLAPHEPNHQYMEGLTDLGAPLPPGENRTFRLGTDSLGRDVASRLIYGARVSLVVGVLANGLAMTVGVLVGTIAGYLRIGGTLIMRFVDIMMSIPSYLLAMALVSVLRPSLAVVIVVIAAVYWTYLARLVYGEVLSVKEYDFILAAQSVGVPISRIIIRHILPQLLPLIIVYLTLGISTTIRVEATLSFLGLGVQPPMSSWGGMMKLGRGYFRSAPWLVLLPGLAVTFAVLGFNLLGEGLRDALDPRRLR